MTDFPIHTVETAPEGSKAQLEAINKKYGAIPGLFGALAEAPAALEAYPLIQGIFEKSSLSPTEQQLVFIAASVENECLFCVPAHSFVAKNVTKVDPAIVNAVRNSQTVPDAKLDALVTFTRTVVEKRGHLEDADIAGFINAGYTQANVLEVILGVSVKTLSNYTSHVTNPPLGGFASEAWEPKASKTAA